MGRLRSCVHALGGFLALEVRWQGAAVDLLTDARHAALQDWTARLLNRVWRPNPGSVLGA